jgi:hypothetical protein
MKILSRSILVLAALIYCACAAAWYRSYSTTDLITWGGSGGRHYELVTIPGQVRFTQVTNWVEDEPFVWSHRRPQPPLSPVFGQQLMRSAWFAVGIGFDGGSRTIPAPQQPGNPYTGRTTVAYQIVAFAFALPTLLAGLIMLWPLFRIWKWRRLLRERRKAGLCPACGYDLRATPGRCPECGKVAA